MRLNSGLDLTIASLNCRGLRNNLKRAAIFDKCKTFDIIALQETHITDNVVEHWKKLWAGEFFYSEGNSRSKGQILLVRKHLTSTNSDICIKTERILGINITIDGKKYTTVNIYGPDRRSDRKQFIDELIATLDTVHPTNVIVCGDFNMVLDNTLDIISGDLHNKEDVDAFNK